MASKIEPPPASAQVKATEALARVERARAKLGRDEAVRMGLAVERAVPAGKLGQPYPLYVIDAVDVARRRTLEAARLAGWRYTLLGADAPGGVLELRKAGTRVTFAKLHEGDRGARCESAVAKVREQASGSARPLAIRVLRIPSLNLLAAWGHAEGAGEDVFVPIAPAPAPFTPGEPISQGQLVEGVLGIGPPASGARRGRADPTLPRRKAVRRSPKRKGSRRPRTR